MQHRSMVVTGFGFVALMHASFLWGTIERGPLYAVVQLVGLVAALGAVWGLRAGGSTTTKALALTFGALALTRVLQVALDLSRLPLWLNLALTLAYVGGAASAASWAARPDRAASAAQGVRAAAWSLMALHFFGSVIALSGGRLPGILGLALGTIGFSLVAPNLDAPSAPQAARVVVGGGHD